MAKVTRIGVNLVEPEQTETTLLKGLVNDGDSMSPMVRVGLEALELSPKSVMPTPADIYDRVMAAYERFRAPSDRQAVILVGMHIAAITGGTETVSAIAQAIGRLVA